MMKTIHAIYEQGVFRPLEPIDLPDKCQVEVEVRAVKNTNAGPSLDSVYSILNKRFSSGESEAIRKVKKPSVSTGFSGRKPRFPDSLSDVSARHNEHQP